MSNELSESNQPHHQLSRAGRLTVIIAAFLGWMLAGVNMAIVPLAGRSAAIGLGVDQGEGLVGVWFARFTCAFLLGAASGGLLFGIIGDRIGRAKAMGLSIICYSLFTFAGYFVTTPLEFLVVRFFACLGVGGMWPTGVALASEAWSNASRPLLSGLIGTAANVGFILISSLAMWYPITPDSWRWVMLVASAPVVLGVVVLLLVPESPLWLSSAGRRRIGESTGPSGARIAMEPSAAARSTLGEVFRPPLLKLTLLGMCLGAVPMMGNWGGANWLVPWAGKVEQAQGTHSLKAQTQWSKSAGAAVGSLLGGWLASQLGRRSTYFVFSLVSLAISNYIFWFLHPGAPSFLAWVAAIGFFGTVYFGWLPLYLPELFPTSVRATGTGVAFNFGRIATAVGVLGAGQLMQAFGGDYARMGRATCLVYLLGMIIIFFAPDTSRKRLTDVA